jgi:hypothetical protein
MTARPTATIQDLCRYDVHPCGTCDAPANALALSDHGHVAAAACSKHRTHLARTLIDPGNFIIEIAS